jgi:hypothetical protein
MFPACPELPCIVLNFQPNCGLGAMGRAAPAEG